ncbi:U1 small nuclear ribonucleoprotein 70 kDa-like [Elysia marginata]|uniref:U1 small nuclear ribonucleoprotein 70 kDa n=1 Tax=Elysia marginata TaxID=1093978 RepID=A0AAV4GEP3_9GAST|nr:U1 small nuclear ribonucleoprotein 70 kDa-like [Elysia marginata]
MMERRARPTRFTSFLITFPAHVLILLLIRAGQIGEFDVMPRSLSLSYCYRADREGCFRRMSHIQALHVGGLGKVWNYDTSESKLRREFEGYGTVKKISVINDRNTGKPRGYAFIEYEHERDMHSAYKNADGKKIDGRRVLVDVERGRTVKGWRPRRLGK